MAISVEARQLLGPGHTVAALSGRGVLIEIGVFLACCCRSTKMGILWSSPSGGLKSDLVSVTLGLPSMARTQD
jgi:hypothetical protein